MANINLFPDLKKVCTPEQTQKLYPIYSELYGCENKGQGNGQGKVHGKGIVIVTDNRRIPAHKNQQNNFMPPLFLIKS